MGGPKPFRTLAQLIELPRSRSALVPAIERTIRWVDQIHRFPVMPRPEVVFTRTRRSSGWYDCSKHRIEISFCAERSELTFLHEVGHLVDCRFFSPLRRWSSELGHLESMLVVADRSKAIRSMHDLLDREISVYERNFIESELQSREIFARAYAQFIVARSGDDKINNELSAITELPYALECNRQWKPDDFAPIEAAIADLLRRDGYLR